MGVGLSIIVGSMALVVLEALASYYLSQNFWPSQVMTRWGRPGISFFAHGGMWGDFFLLPTLLAWVIVKYGPSWNIKMIMIMGMVGLLVTLGNHLLLIFTQKIPDPLGWQEEWWSVPIALHFVYMSTYVALAGLFYFSPGVSIKDAAIVSVVLGIHMVFGTHVPLGILNQWNNWDWCPDLLASDVLPYLLTGIWSALVVLASMAAGPLAGSLVGILAIGLATAGWAVVRIIPILFATLK